MLGKLIKLDLWFGWKKFVSIAAVMVAAGIFMPILWDVSGLGSLILLYLGVLIIGIMCVYICVQYFRSNLFGSEGYLMFTLPVSTTQLITSKLITTVFWFNFMLASAGLSVVLLGRISPMDLWEILITRESWSILLSVLISANAIGIPTITAVYFGASITNITFRNRPIHGIIATIVSIICVIGANRFTIRVETEFYRRNFDEMFASGQSWWLRWGDDICALGAAALSTFIFFMLTRYIATKKLNLR